MKTGDKLAVMADNCVEYLVAMQAAFNQGFVLVPIYPSFGSEDVAHVLDHCKTEVVVVGAECARMLASVAGSCKKLRHVVVIPRHGGIGKLGQGKVRSPLEAYKAKDDLEEDEMGEINEDFGNAERCLYDDVEREGQENTDSGPTTAPGDVAAILYTAGTTGAPKGVVHTNGSLVACIGGFVPILSGLLPSDVYYSYLPLANSLEIVCVNAILACGGAIGVYSGHLANLIADLEMLRPTILSGIPWIYERMYKKLMQQVTKSNGLKQWLFTKGLNTKKEKAQQGGDSGWWNFMVFKKLRTRMGGGRVRLALSANAPLSPTILNFLEVVFGCRVQQVYNLTEVGIATITNATDPDKDKTVGVPILSLEMKLVDTGKFSTKKEVPAGEICFRGPAVAKEYYKDDQLTSQAFDADGWFHTGDIGELRGNGTLTLVDREESIASLSTGAVAPTEKLEAIYNRSQFISQIFVYGDSSEPCLVAVVSVLPSVLRSFANARNVRDQFADPDDVAALCEDEKMRNIIVSDLRKLARANSLDPSNLVRGVFLDVTDWTAEDGLATPMLKLRHQALLKKYKKRITDVYDELKAEARAALQPERERGVEPSPRRESDSESENASD